MKLHPWTFCPKIEFPQNIFGPRLPCGYTLQALTYSYFCSQSIKETFKKHTRDFALTFDKNKIIKAYFLIKTDHITLQ